MSLISKIRITIASLLLLAAALLWGWVLWPVPYAERIIDLPRVSPIDSRFSALAEKINQNGLQIRLVYPARLNVGEQGNIQVRLYRSEVRAEPLTLSTDTQVMVEGRIVLPLAQIDPPDRIQSTFSPENSTLLAWQIKSAEKGVLSGQFWFYLLFVAPDGSTERQALVAVPMIIKESQLLGLPENILIWAAAALTLVGLAVLSISWRLRYRS